MSSAFSREQDDNLPPVDIGERPVSSHRNLVTAEGLAQIDGEIASLREELAKAEGAGDRERIAFVSRDLRYWNARRETAEVALPEPDETVVRFGMIVMLESEDGKTHSWKIVGEDEADTSKGTISHAAPLVRALFGRSVGETVEVNGKEWEIVGLEVPKDGQPTGSSSAT